MLLEILYQEISPCPSLLHARPKHWGLDCGADIVDHFESWASRTVDPYPVALYGALLHFFFVHATISMIVNSFVQIVGARSLYTNWQEHAHVQKRTAKRWVT